MREGGGPSSGAHSTQHSAVSSIADGPEVLLPLQAWCVIAEGRTTCVLQDKPITIFYGLSGGPTSIDT